MTAYKVRPMRIEDVPQAVEIEREAFPTQWPPTPFKRELQNRLAHYLVVCNEGEVWEAPPRRGLPLLLGRLGRLLTRRQPPSPHSHHDQPFLVGSAGFWRLYDEAHITTIAVRESHRRQGLGELLLHACIELAVSLRSRVVTLEVRASNHSAQTLYEKYGFQRSGVRRGYYTDNNEDAIIMTTDALDSPSFRERFQRLKQDLAHRMNIALSAEGWPLA
ncbi:MAG: ribosomal protein S18-alanine N-acetyltransferase [Dehalococcoidia bacterium]